MHEPAAKDTNTEDFVMEFNPQTNSFQATKTFSVKDLQSCICFECRYKDRVMEDASNCANIDSEPVRDFIQTGNLDPSVHWKTYAQLAKEELDEFHRRRERLQRAWNGPYIPLKEDK